MTDQPPIAASSATAVPAPLLPSLHWRRWIVFWSFAAVAIAALLSFDARLDTFLWCSTRWFFGDGNPKVYAWDQYHAAHAGDASAPFYMTQSPPFDSQLFQSTKRFWALCKLGGDALWVAPPVLIFIAIFCRRRRLLAAWAAAAMALAGLVSWLIRAIDGRWRPTHTDGANQWDLFRGFGLHVKDLSFPSGHATLAFAAAAVLAYAFPRTRYIVIPLAALTGITRVVQQAHFWSDVIMGAALGWTVAWFTMYCGDRLLRQHARRKTLPKDG